MLDGPIDCQPPAASEIAGILWRLQLTPDNLLDCPPGIAVSLADLYAAEAAGAVILRAKHPSGTVYWAPLSRLRAEGKILVTKSGRLIALMLFRWDQELPSGQILRVAERAIGGRP
jgi:hypothetical protein